MHIQLLLCIK